MIKRKSLSSPWRLRGIAASSGTISKSLTLPPAVAQCATASRRSREQAASWRRDTETGKRRRDKVKSLIDRDKDHFVVDLQHPRRICQAGCVIGPSAGTRRNPDLFVTSETIRCTETLGQYAGKSSCRTASGRQVAAAAGRIPRRMSASPPASRAPLHPQRIDEFVNFRDPASHFLSAFTVKWINRQQRDAALYRRNPILGAGVKSA